MKIAKPIMLMAIGAGTILAYQKYSEPVINKIEDMANEAVKAMNKKLDDMS